MTFRWTIIGILLCLFAGCRSAEVALDDPAEARALCSGQRTLQHAYIGSEIVRLRQAEPPTIQPVTFEEPVESPRDPELLPAPAPLGESNLTLAELEQLALSNNPALAEAAANADAARGNWTQVGLPPNPWLGYSGQQLGSPGDIQQGVYLQQEFVMGGKLRQNRNVASWELEQAQRLLAAQRLRVLTDVRMAFYEVLIAQRRLELTKQLVAIGEQAVEAAEALLKGQEVGEADPLRAKIEADTARILSQNADNQLRAAWRKLAAVVGVPDIVPTSLQGEMEPDVLGDTWRDTVGQLLSKSPEVAAAAANVEAAHWALHRAQVEAVPNVDVQAVVQHDNSVGGTNANVQVSLPIPIVNRNQGGIRKAQAELIAAERAVDRLALDLQTRLADTLQRYESAQNQVQKYKGEEGILANAERTLKLIRTGYVAGEFGVIDLLSAQRTYFQANLAYLDSLRELWVATTEIRGLLLKGGLPR